MPITYVLDTDGSVKEYIGDNLNKLENVKDKSTLTKTQNSFTKIVKEKNAYGININSENTFDSENILGLKDSNPHTKVNQSANKNFDFVNENRNNLTTYFRDFNNYKDKDDVFASEFEILGGIKGINLDSNKYAFFFLDYFVEFASYFLVLEGIVLLNSLVQDTNSVEEKYHLKIGDYNIVEYDVYSRYVFDVLNYPKESREFLMTFSERLTCFFLGFNEFLNPDRLIDYDKIINDTTKYKNLMDLITDDVKNKSNLNLVFNSFGLQPIIAAASLLVETFAVLNNSSEKRLLLLIRKFANQKIWEDGLFRFKNNNDGNFSFLREMDYYRVRFGIERIHVGRKILKYHWYNATHLPHRLKEAPQNRLGISKSRYKSQIEIAHDKNYNWSLERSGNNYDNDEDFSQGTRLRALPQLLNLNAEYVANIVLNKLSSPDNEKEMLPIGKDLLQNFYYNNNKRIPDSLVEQIENHLESEYMPFYFRDLRTNEIISFHAFLDNISDTFSTDYSEMTGFGRVDSVKAYTKTTRSISLGFTLASTSQSDHDLMWYQINKLITMCYPQWSDGVDNTYEVGDKKIEGKFPFSQVITASPLIRLRVGDVIKSNYSKTNLSRLHGSPFKEIKDKVKDTDKNKNIEETSDGSAKAKTEEKPNPIDILDILSSTKEFLYVLPGMYRTVTGSGFGGPQYIHIKNHTKVKKSTAGFLNFLTASLLDKNDLFEITSDDSQFKGQIIAADKRSVIAKSPLGDSSSDTPKLPLPIPINIDESKSAQDENVTNLKSIMEGNFGTSNVTNNPIVKAFESGMGRGLAGFITQLDLQYGDSTWETGRIGSKAPIFLKINIVFNPIHDIAPGLDHNGMMRAPTHNIGRINNEMFGDPYDNTYLGEGRREAEKKLDNYEKEASK